MKHTHYLKVEYLRVYIIQNKGELQDKTFSFGSLRWQK